MLLNDSDVSQAATVNVQDLGKVKASLAGAGKDIAQELANLSQLHKSGDLSDAEFDAAKKKLLGV